MDAPPSVIEPGAAFEPVSLEDIIAEHRERQPAGVGRVGDEATRRRQARQAALCLMVGVVGAAAIVVMVVVSWLRSSSEEEELQAGSE